MRHMWMRGSLPLSAEQQGLLLELPETGMTERLTRSFLEIISTLLKAAFARQWVGHSVWQMSTSSSVYRSVLSCSDGTAVSLMRFVRQVKERLSALHNTRRDPAMAERMVIRSLPSNSKIWRQQVRSSSL